LPESGRAGYYSSTPMDVKGRRPSLADGSEDARVSELVTKRQTAARFQVFTRTIDRWRSESLAKPAEVKSVVRFREADLESLARRTVK